MTDDEVLYREKLNPAWWMWLLFLGLAVANEIVWRSMTETTWVYFKTFGMPVVIFVFLMANAGLFRAHSIEVPTDDATK